MPAPLVITMLAVPGETGVIVTEELVVRTVAMVVSEETAVKVSGVTPSACTAVTDVLYGVAPISPAYVRFAGDNVICARLVIVAEIVLVIPEPLVNTMSAVPGATGVMVTALPLAEAVATAVLLDATVKVSDVVPSALTAVTVTV
jgi:hypothetical protein